MFSKCFLSQAFVMLDYMSKLANRIGKEEYLNSLIRLEHGTGTGFFGVSNTGSTDCIKERFRRFIDSLGRGQNYNNWEKIKFVSESCLSTTVRTTHEHRIEHTRDVIDLFKKFESEYVVTHLDFTANDLGVWLIENQVVCFIRKEEQRGRSYYDDNRPFPKYSSKIFYKNQDISDLTLEQIKDINRFRFASEIQEIRGYDFTELNKNTTSKLIGGGSHTLPPLDLATQYHTSKFELLLLDLHYEHKRLKRTTLANTWYNAEDDRRWLVYSHDKKCSGFRNALSQLGITVEAYEYDLLRRKVKEIEDEMPTGSSRILDYKIGDNIIQVYRIHPSGYYDENYYEMAESPDVYGLGYNGTYISWSSN